MHPQSAWDRDPEGTYRKVMNEIARDEKNGYLIGNEVSRLRNAAGKCYMKAKRKQR